MVMIILNDMMIQKPLIQKLDKLLFNESKNQKQ